VQSRRLRPRERRRLGGGGCGCGRRPQAEVLGLLRGGGRRRRLGRGCGRPAEAALSLQVEAHCACGRLVGLQLRRPVAGGRCGGGGGGGRPLLDAPQLPGLLRLLALAPCLLPCDLYQLRLLARRRVLHATHACSTVDQPAPQRQRSTAVQLTTPLPHSSSDRGVRLRARKAPGRLTLRPRWLLWSFGDAGIVRERGA
jgi:hypothetical protein